MDDFYTQTLGTHSTSGDAKLTNHTFKVTA